MPPLRHSGQILCSSPDSSFTSILPLSSCFPMPAEDSHVSNVFAGSLKPDLYDVKCDVFVPLFRAVTTCGVCRLREFHCSRIVALPTGFPTRVYELWGSLGVGVRAVFLSFFFLSGGCNMIRISSLPSTFPWCLQMQAGGRGRTWIAYLLLTQAGPPLLRSH